MVEGVVMTKPIIGSDIWPQDPGDSINTYEIHYVLHGLKTVTLHEANRMTETDAWMIAVLDAGLQSAALPKRMYLSLIQTIAEGQGVTKVRWNLCPRTIHD
jgi:hypothetical protein